MRRQEFQGSGQIVEYVPADELMRAKSKAIFWQVMFIFSFLFQLLILMSVDSATDRHIQQIPSAGNYYGYEGQSKGQSKG